MPEALQRNTAPTLGGGRLQSIQVARGVAALSVVGFHAISIEQKYFGGIGIVPPVLEGGMAGVDLFFVISGFVMVLTTRGRHGKHRKVGEFAWNRAFRIYPTYWFYFLILLPVFLFAPSLINSSAGNQVDLFASFFLLPSDLLPLLLVGWTLTLELWFYIVFSVLLFLPERTLPWALGFWFAVLVAVNWAGPISASPYIEVPANAMAIEFIFGAVAALVFRRVNLIAAGVCALAGVAFLVTIGIPTPMDITAGPGLARPMTLGLGLALLVLAVTAFEARRGIGIVGRLSFLGDISYSVYLSHVLVMSVLGRLWSLAAGSLATNQFAVVVAWILVFAAVLVWGWLSYRLIEKPVMRLSTQWRRRVFAESPR